MTQILQYDPEYFVWVDETGSDAKNHICKFGYALRGQTPVYHRFQKHWSLTWVTTWERRKSGSIVRMMLVMLQIS